MKKIVSSTEIPKLMEPIKTAETSRPFPKRPRAATPKVKGITFGTMAKRPILNDLKRIIIKRVRQVIDKIRDIRNVFNI